MVALPRRPAGSPPNAISAYLLRAAVQTRRTVNGFGLVVRVALALGISVCLAMIEWRNLLWAVPMWIGLGVATLEWTEVFLDRWSTTAPRSIAFVARFLIAAREKAWATPSGVLEGVVGPVLCLGQFAGPFAVETQRGLRLTACLLIVLYVTSAAMQVTNDASLYNYRDQDRMRPSFALLRAVYPLLYAGVALGLFLSTDDSYISVTESLALAAVCLLIYPMMGLSDAAHFGSTHAHASSLQETLDFVRAAYSSDIHRLKSSIRARAAFTQPETKKALQDVFLQTELIRQLIVSGRADAAINDAVSAAHTVVMDRSPDARVAYEVHPSIGGVVVDATGLELTERIILDIVDNAIRAAAPEVTVEVSGTETAHRAIAMQVVVRDNGPGFKVPIDLPRASSMRQLQRQCQRMDGDFVITSSPAGTEVTATFVTPKPARGD